jgi:hypothetical protein
VCSGSSSPFFFSLWVRLGALPGNATSLSGLDYYTPIHTPLVITCQCTATPDCQASYYTLSRLEKFFLLLPTEAWRRHGIDLNGPTTNTSMAVRSKLGLRKDCFPSRDELSCEFSSLLWWGPFTLYWQLPPLSTTAALPTCIVALLARERGI